MQNKKEMEPITQEDIEKVEIKQMQEYLVCETIRNQTGDIVSIMDLQLPQLIFEKMFLLFERLRVAENNLETAKIDLQIKKDTLLLETDFKTVLNESRPTVAMKEAYMKPHLADFENKVDKYNQQAVFYKDKINIINDLIRKERLLLEIEGGLKQ